jgi:glycosyltransferase involved in cell wall biosynthesis
MCKYENFPFIYTLWDLGHLNSYAFPEVSNEGIYEERKNHHDNIPFKALMVFCESETGKKEAIHYLRLNEERVRVLPLFPSGVISEKMTPSKPQMIDSDSIFIHYPAQYWAHKNHYNLILAFLLIAKKYPHLKLILTGSDHGNKKTYITKIINENNLEDRVIDLGFVPLEELKWLYLHSKGLIMPTILGPTNMPPLEAVALGCPVAVSDLPGHREQLGDNAKYFNPLDIEEIKNAIEYLFNNDNKPTTSLLLTIQTNMVLLDKYFGEIKTIRHTWA